MLGTRGRASPRRIDAASQVVPIPRTHAPLGFMPQLVVTAGLGLLLVAGGDTLSRRGVGWAEGVFWIGLLVLVMPIAARLLGASARRTERLLLVMLLGVALYAVKVFHDPLGFTFSDEFAQLRTLMDIMGSDRLFTPSPLLPITPYYPGLPSSTSAVAETTGLSAFAAAVFVIGAARFVLVAALFLLVEVASRSSRVAGIAALVYAANPNFVFFGAQAAYESLALPLAAIALLAATYGAYVGQRQRRAFTALAVAAILATVVTHHLTSFALAGLLVAWTVVWLIRKRPSVDPAPWRLALFATAAATAWTLLVANSLVGYLSPVLGGAVTELFRVINGEEGTRQLFRGAASVAPLWEQLLGFGAVGLILLGIPFGLYRMVRGDRDRVLMLTIALAAVAYPATLALRLTTAGAETAQRASEFLFPGIGAVLGIAVVELFLRGQPGRARYAATLAAAGVIFVGGLIVGWPTWARLPGPYLVGADTRSIEREGVRTAGWFLDELGPGNRIVADRTNRLLVGSYGLQRPVTGYGDLLDTKTLILSPQLGEAERAVARQGDVRYVVIDRRLSTAVPATGIYVERGELRTLGGIRREPLGADRLAKYDGVPGISRVYDSGSIQLYDIGAWVDAP